MDAILLAAIPFWRGGPMADKKTILIIDDDADLAEGLRMILEREGFRVIHADNGQDGRQAINIRRPDLVLLDMMMPRMGGFPVLEHCSRDPQAPPIVMMTANEGSRHKAYAEMLGVVDYL